MYDDKFKSYDVERWYYRELFIMMQSPSRLFSNRSPTHLPTTVARVFRCAGCGRAKWRSCASDGGHTRLRVGVEYPGGRERKNYERDSGSGLTVCM